MMKSRVITKQDKLMCRISKLFDKKKLIGDIVINDDEYEMLIGYFRERYKAITTSGLHRVNDPIFATALVQIGIRNYSGNYWTHVEAVLELEKLSQNQRNYITSAFLNTLKLHNKLLLNNTEFVNNVLMHGFVSDYYANEMFDFFLKYYLLDLERDLARNTKEMMDNLFEVIQRKDNTGRTYLLVQQTANAINMNSRGGKIRIRRLIRQMDESFWGVDNQRHPTARLSILFNKWIDESDEFRTQYNLYHGTKKKGKGSKSFSSPYMQCNYGDTTFNIVLPAQIVSFEVDGEIVWNIKSDGVVATCPTLSYHAITGYKTEEQQVCIPALSIFDKFTIELCNNGSRIKYYKIQKDDLRFFDKEGDFIYMNNNIPKGEVYAFSMIDKPLQSVALIDSERIGDLIRYCFEFEDGDIVKLSNGKTISMGKIPGEGFLKRNLVAGVYALQDEQMIPVYLSSPSLLIKIEESKANGTAIEINGQRTRLLDFETTKFDFPDRSGEIGYILKLSNYGCHQDGLYNILIDIPNDHSRKFWTFALVSNLQYEFEDSPYIFQKKGTIKFPNDLQLEPAKEKYEKNSDENSFNFLIEDDEDEVLFEHKFHNRDIVLYFKVPALKWKFGKEKWNVEKPNDIWHSDFPLFISIKYPEDAITLSLDEDLDSDYEYGEHSVSCLKLKSKDSFECDTTRFKSWLGKEKTIRKLFLESNGKKFEFFNIINHSTIVSHLIKSDFIEEKLIGEFEIIGNSNYYVDVILVDTKETLADKLRLVEGKFELDNLLSSGLYKIKVYEEETDDVGFGLIEYSVIGNFIESVINPYDLQGKSIKIRSIKNGIDGFFEQRTHRNYIIRNLTRIHPDDKHKYLGKLYVENGGVLHLYDENTSVEFFDLDMLQYAYITFFDGYDYVEFLYDTNMKAIVKEEESGLKRSVRYRRYNSIYPEDYVYLLEFTNN
ncbi:MAG: hypothetical protein EOM59_09260 [Clostridia bacterium]|nr:hypothetical protein [Clostridia bacterium]